MKKLIYILTTGLLLTFSSCESLLDRPPLDKIGNGSYWKTPQDFENYTLQFYSKFPGFATNDKGGVNIYLGSYGYDAFNGSDHAIAGTVPHTMLNGSGATQGTNAKWNWGDIRAVNVFFENLETTKVSRAEIKHFIGEAHFFKAWFYFEKLMNFGDVPWFTTTLYMNSPELYKPRDARNVVADSILFHMDQAIANLEPLSKMTSLGNSNRLSREAALLFKSRIALFEGSWEKYHNGTDFGVKNANWNKYFKLAAEAAEELMNGTYKVGIYDKNKPAEDYAFIFGQDDFSAVNEIILWRRYDIALELGNRFQPFVTSFTATVSINDNLVRNYLGKNGQPIDYDALTSTYKGSPFLTELGLETDARLSQTIWIPGSLVSDNAYNQNGLPRYFSKPNLSSDANGYNGTGFQLRKGVNPKSINASAPATTVGNTGLVIFRYAEALLNYAEAKAELGETVDYTKSLNLLRNRAGMPDFNKDLVDVNRAEYADFGYSLSNELYEIRRERAVELACEGFRNMDFRRWAGHKLIQGKSPKGYPFDPTEWTVNINTKRDANGLMDPLQDGVGTEGYGFNEKRDYLDFIPTNEITANPALKPNPGWE